MCWYRTLDIVINFLRNLFIAGWKQLLLLLVGAVLLLVRCCVDVMARWLMIRERAVILHFPIVPCAPSIEFAHMTGTAHDQIHRCIRENCR